MAFSKRNLPAVRYSDIDDLMRENALDSSDGQKLIDYIKRKQGAARPRLNQLFDGADIPINFRFDHLQPVPARHSTQTSSETPKNGVRSTTAETERAAPEIALVQPRPIFQDQIRVASFATSSKEQSASGSRMHSQQCAANSHIARSPSVQRLASPKSMDRPILSANRNRQVLLKECQRANLLKSEKLRLLASSTPNAGEKRPDRSNDNFMSFKETISPIFEDRASNEFPASAGMMADTPQTRLSVHTVPATQDQPDAVERNARENTPPTDGQFIVPETPSPVRRFPDQTASLSALSMYRSPLLRNPADLRRVFSKQVQDNQICDNDVPTSNNSVASPTQKSILKKRSDTPRRQSTEQMAVLPSPRNRVSFASKLHEVIHMSPAYVRSPNHSDVTSDENTDDGDEPSPSRSVQSREARFIATDIAGNPGYNSSQKNATACITESRLPRFEALDVHEQFEHRNEQLVVAGRSAKNQTNSDAVNMITEDWNGSGSPDGDSAGGSSPVAAKLSQQHTISSPMAITNIDTPRSVMMDILDPPSAFCDIEQTEREVLPPEEEVVDEVVPSEHSRSAASRMQNQSVRQTGECQYHGNDASVKTVETLDEHGTRGTFGNHTRIVSTNSPGDRIPSTMIEFVNRIHIQSSPAGELETENARWTRIVVPTKKRLGTFKKADRDTESYFQAVEQTCNTRKKASKHRKGFERRKLFAKDIPAVMDTCELGVRTPSPEPLPMTQELETIQPLVICLKRLSTGTIDRLINGNDKRKNTQHAVVETDSIEEKQHTEETEKASATSAMSADRVCTDMGALESAARDTEPAIAVRPNVKKAKNKPKKKQNPHRDGLGQKYWKDVSNELRQHVEGDGLRRSNRNRRIPNEVLFRHPELSKYDAPKYVMPTVEDLLDYYHWSEKKKPRANRVRPKKPAKQDKVTTENDDGNGGVERMLPHQKRKGNKKDKANYTSVGKSQRCDDDGFQIPAQPVTVPASQTQMQPKRYAFSSGVSNDSGLSSAVMTNCDETETLPTEQQQLQQAGSSLLKTRPSPQKGAMNDIQSEKRQAMEWMWMLMENRQERPEALMAIEVQGYTHCTLEHLTFHRRGDIEYSFYIYSKRDNFGFVRLLPNAKKKMTRVNNFHLKFLILNGSFTMTINEHEVKPVGGDFLMLPAGSTYRIINGSGISLLFMIKTAIDSAA